MGVTERRISCHRKYRFVIMKILFSYLLLALFLFQVGRAQNMANIFRLLPSYYVYDLNRQQKDSLLKKKEYYPPGDSIESVKYNLEIDEQHQYFRCEFGFTTGQNGFSILEGRKFTKADGTHLLLLSKYGGMLHSHYQQDLQFFVIQKDRLMPIKNSLLPKEISVEQFLKKGAPDSIISKLESYISSNYDLSPDRRNIVSFSVFPEVIINEYEEYIAGYTMRFEWTGKNFKRILLSNKE